MMVQYIRELVAAASLVLLPEGLVILPNLRQPLSARALSLPKAELI